MAHRSSESVGHVFNLQFHTYGSDRHCLLGHQANRHSGDVCPLGTTLGANCGWHLRNTTSCLATREGTQHDHGFAPDRLEHEDGFQGRSEGCVLAHHAFLHNIARHRPLGLHLQEQPEQRAHCCQIPSPALSGKQKRAGFRVDGPAGARTRVPSGLVIGSSLHIHLCLAEDCSTYGGYRLRAEGQVQLLVRRLQRCMRTLATPPCWQGHLY
mmetsp:Transcript_22293/g.51949  ORF Transcript_22293/g.51949 Transcript_22293/m.51949 type:complete len:211 (+) Transcript_22293:616-1248(+)